jgi:hypothetical protein
MDREPQLRGWPKGGEPPFTVVVVDETHVFTPVEMAVITERTLDRIMFGGLFASTAGER